VVAAKRAKAVKEVMGRGLALKRKCFSAESDLDKGRIHVFLFAKQ
jgi:hypothetical protein